MANPVGRPRIIKSPEEFDRLVDGYLKLCEDGNKPITFTGMVLALGLCSKQSFYEYGQFPEFGASVSRARHLIECSYEEKLHSSPKDVNGSSMQFALKNFGWVDKLDINHGGQKDNPVQIDAGKLSDSALNELMALRGSDKAN